MAPAIGFAEPRVNSFESEESRPSSVSDDSSGGQRNGAGGGREESLSRHVMSTFKQDMIWLGIVVPVLHALAVVTTSSIDQVGLAPVLTSREVPPGGTSYDI